MPNIEHTQESGLSVEIPVDPTRISVWKTVLYNAFLYYEVIPECINFTPNTLAEVVFQGDNFLLRKSHAANYRQKIDIVVSSRRYTLDNDKMKTECADYIASHFFTNRQISNHTLELKFNTGEISLDMSRENIQYNKTTIEAIKTRVADVLVSIKKTFDDAQDEAEDMLQYIRLTNELWKKYGLSYGIDVYFTKDNKFNVQLGLDNSYVDSNIVVESQNSKVKVKNPNSIRFCNGKFAQVSYTKAAYTLMISLAVFEAGNIKIVVDDIRTAKAAASAAFPDHLIIMIQKSDVDVMISGLQKYMVYASQLEKPSTERKKREKVVTEYYTIFCKRFVRRVLSPEFLKVAKFVLITGASFDCVQGMIFTDKTASQHKIVGVKSLDHVPEGGVLLVDELQKEFDRYTPEVVDFLYLQNFLSIAKLYLGKDSALVLGITHKNSLFGKYQDLLYHVESNKNKYREFSLYEYQKLYHNFKTGSLSRPSIFVDLMAEIMIKYPLVGYMKQFNIPNPNDLVQYINFIDSL